MIRNNLYYGIKPLVPIQIRLAVRGWLTRRRRDQFRNEWPMLPGSERRPEDWPGWPDGKKFAFVLTHDVEGPEGVAKCRRLMEVEKKCGFRSSFNFIPEANYRISREFRQIVAREGFEVSLHDLYHDGRLYRSRAEFAKNATRINMYLKEWGSRGFRSGFMFHNLEWLQDLEIEYDASTFDTDPFEPQPDGTGTIFPFWYQQGAGRGYVEMPYTLPQDSTLFLLMRERTPDLWKQKTDWIARHGGMALLNTHPDYMSFDGARLRISHYPLANYESFLRHVATAHAGAYWNPLPMELAAWYKQARVKPQPAESRARLFAEDLGVAAVAPKTKPPAKPDRAAVVLYAYYATDSRPRREAEALAREGFDVDVISLGSAASDPARETINDVNVVIAPWRHQRGDPFRYSLQYICFFLSALFLLSKWSLTKRYKVVHVHNMPDFLVFSALLPRLRGAKVILDLHDPMPELFEALYGVAPGHFASRMLRRIEKWSIGFADLVLTPNAAFKELFVSRGCPEDKIEIVMNTPETEIFHERKAAVPAAGVRGVRPFKLMYHGVLVERHGMDLAVEAVAKLRARISGLELHFYGEETDYMKGIMLLVRERKLEDAVFFHGYKSLAEIAEAIAPIDLGLIPNRLNSFTRINLPTRIFEYLAMNKAVIAPRTQGVQDYFKEDELVFFEPGDVEDLARKIEWVYRHPDETRSILARGRKVYEEHSWDLERGRFTGLVKRLLTGGERTPGRAARPKRVCMIAYSNYDNDNRVMRYAEELAHRGDSVEVLALRGNRGTGRSNTICGVRVFGIQSRARKDEKSRSSYLWPLLKFSSQAWAVVTWRHLTRRYDLVHVHNMPDFLVFTAWVPRLTGAKVILDIHDIVPEFYASKFDVKEHRYGVRILKGIERAAARFSHHVIISNHLWRDKFAARTGTESKCTVFVNNVNSDIFIPRPRTRRDGKFIIIFPGGLQWHQGLDIALRAFEIVSPQAPAAQFHIYGDGAMKQSLMDLTRDLGLEDKVSFFDPMPLRAIAEVMANADLGVVPKRADSFGNEAYSTKIMEFMSLGIPVVVSSTKIDRFYFDDSVVRFFESGNVEALASAMLEMIRNRDLRESMARRASEYAVRNSWDTRKADYLNLVDCLCSPAAGGNGQLARQN